MTITLQRHLNGFITAVAVMYGTYEHSKNTVRMGTCGESSVKPQRTHEFYAEQSYSGIASSNSGRRRTSEYSLHSHSLKSHTATGL